MPLRVAFFRWIAALSKILTHDNLRKRNIVIVKWCCMCKKNEETVNYLLLHCEIASALWHTIFSWFGLLWVMPCRVGDLFDCWWPGGCSRSAVVWKMIPLCLMWCLWSERNARCVDNSNRTLEELIHFFLNTLYSWTAAWLTPLVISFSDFLFHFSPS